MTDETKTPESDEENEDTALTATKEGEDEHDRVEFVEEPAFDVDYKGDCAYEVRTVIAGVNEKKEAEKIFGKLKGEVELPGFRRGRAPLRLVENKFGKAVKGEVEGKLVSAAFEKLVEKEDLNPIGLPDIDGADELTERKEGEPLEVTFKFEVSPRMELGKYRGVEIERPVVKIDEKDIQESVEQMLSRYAVYEDLEGGVAAQEDQVIIDFSGTIDGEEFEGSKAENYPYILGSKRFFPEFEDVILGSSPGAELTCDVTFPDDYFAENLRRKQALFTIKVNEIKRRNVPELTDEFAQQLEYENVEDMREKVGGQLRQAAQARSTQAAEAAALEAVIEDSTFEIPASMIQTIADGYVEDETRRLMSMRLPRDQIEERMDFMEGEARENAIRNIKSMVTLNEIGEAEGIEITDDDLEKEVESLAQSTGVDLETIGRFLSQKKERNSSIDRLFRNKAMAVIMENAEIVDKELTREEMENEEKDSTQG